MRYFLILIIFLFGCESSVKRDRTKRVDPYNAGDTLTHVLGTKIVVTGYNHITGTIYGVYENKCGTLVDFQFYQSEIKK
jgi:hypothetical protein